MSLVLAGEWILLWRDTSSTLSNSTRRGSVMSRYKCLLEELAGIICSWHAIYLPLCIYINLMNIFIINFNFFFKLATSPFSWKLPRIFNLVNIQNICHKLIDFILFLPIILDYFNVIMFLILYRQEYFVIKFNPIYSINIYTTNLTITIKIQQKNKTLLQFIQ